MTGLPQGWALAPINTFARSRSGNSKLIKGQQAQEPAAGLFPAFSASGQDVWVAVPEHEGNAIIISAVGARCGKTFRATGQWSAVANTHIVWPEEVAVDTDWLQLLLNDENFWEKGGSAQPFVKVNATFEREIPLPPLPEQRRIVRRLETLSARSTTARTHLTAIEKLVERMRGAVLSQALNGRLVASQLDCGEPTELGQFITGIEQGWSPKCDNEPELDPTKWAVLTTTAIQAITFDSTENKRLPEILSPRPHLEVEAGDVLMTRAGPRVRCAVCCYVAETAPRRIFSDKIYRIRLDKSVEPEFFAMMMNAPEMVRALDAIKSGGSESGLNLTQDRLKSLAINIWDRPTQVEVVADIKRQFAKIDRLAAEAAKALKLLGHLDQRILAKAFAGDLVPQDPTDEPAETLLARIRETKAAAPKSRRGRK